MLTGKNIIVTGAGGGIGKAMVQLFVEKGAHVWACCRKPKEDTAAFFAGCNCQGPGSVEEVFFNLKNHTEIATGIKNIIAQKKTIHALVNNAAIMSANQLFLMTPISTVRDIFEVNFFAQVTITQMVAKAMLRYPDIQHSIINISSVAALDGDIGLGMVEYTASKAALTGLTRKLARELAPYNIRVNAIAPGLTETLLIANVNEDFVKTSLMTSIGQKMGKPEEIAQIAAFLISENSCRINGQIIRADG